MSALFSPVVSLVVNSTTESLEYNTFQVSGSHLYFLSSVFNFQVTSGFSFLRNDIVYSFLFFFFQIHSLMFETVIGNIFLYFIYLVLWIL